MVLVILQKQNGALIWQSKMALMLVDQDLYDLNAMSLASMTTMWTPILSFPNALQEQTAAFWDFKGTVAWDFKNLSFL